MFKHILLPTDGSETAQRAAAAAVELAKAFQGKVTVISVIEPYPYIGVGDHAVTGFEVYLAAARAAASRGLRVAQTICEEAGVSCETAVMEDRHPHQGILEAAEQAGCDGIVMGSHGRHGVEALLMGSVAHKVLARARVPVVIIR